MNVPHWRWLRSFSYAEKVARECVVVSRADERRAPGLQGHPPENTGLASSPLQAVDYLPLVPEDSLVIFAQQLRSLADVVYFGCRDRRGMSQAAIPVGADI